MADFETDEERRQRLTEMQQALAILGSSYRIPEEGPTSTLPARTDAELPTRAAHALAAYQTREDLPTTPDRIRVREDRPPEALPEDNLGVANAPRFDARPAPRRDELDGRADGRDGPSVDVGPLTLIRQAEEIAPYEERVSHGDVQPNPYHEQRVLPEGVNDALALTGSEYRVPRRFDSRATTSQLREDLAASENDSLQNLAAKRDALVSSGERQSEIWKQHQEAARVGVANAGDHVAEARAQQHEFERRALDRLDRLSQLVDNPPQETRSMARNIMGAILSVASDGRVGDGREAMAREMTANLQRWRATIDANREVFDAAVGMSKYAGSKAEQSARIDAALVDMQLGGLKTALEHERATAGNQFDVFAANQALYTLEQVQLNKEIIRREEKEAADAKAERERARSEEDWNITRTLADLPEQHRADVAARIGPRAVELLADLQKNEATQAGIEETRAKTEKERRELTAGPKLTEGERKVDDLIEGIAGPSGPYARLEKILREGKGDPSKMDMPRFGVGGISSVVNNPLSGWIVPEENVQQDADIQALTEAVLRAESGASITAGDIKAKADALGINSTDETVRARALISLMQRARAIDNQGRLTRPAGANSKTRFTPDAPSIKQVVAGRGRGAQ